MGRTRAALYGLACAFVAVATPAAAFFGNDPWATGSVNGSSSAYGNTPGYGYQTDQAFRAQAAVAARLAPTRPRTAGRSSSK